MPKLFKDLVVTIDPVNRAPDTGGQVERTYQSEAVHSRLVGSDGQEIVISDAAFDVLKKILPTLESRRATITIAPATAELTTQQVADALNMSHPYLMKLLEEGKIPYVMVGTHRRIRSRDLEDYQTLRNAQRRKVHDELTQLMEDEGLLD
jgi:excisionase family DNA binding protein